MIEFQEALDILINSATKMDTESVHLSRCIGRVLAEDVVSERDLPPCNVSGMDGYACRREDLKQPMRVVGTVPAGEEAKTVAGPGECLRIMTGAKVPDETDTVVMYEHTSEENEIVTVLKHSSHDNIRRKGEDLSQGAVVLSAGTTISPAEVAVLASVGKDSVAVYRKPKIAVIATGDELVEPGSSSIKDYEIRNSNSYQLCAQIEKAGCESSYLGIALDTPESIESKLNQALDVYDVILLSGGVSMGDFDYVPSVLKKSGIKLKFKKVAVKPGKPTLFGTKGNTAVFGMPGNPVSTFVIFETLIKPFLYKMRGSNYSAKRIKALPDQSITRKKADRLGFIPVNFTETGHIIAVKYNGSGHIHAFTSADGMVKFDKGQFEIPAASPVDTLLLS